MCSPWNIKDVKEGGSGEIFRKPVKLLILLPFWGSLPSLMGFKQPLNKYQWEQDIINMFHVNPWFVLNKQADLLGGNVRNILMVPNFRGWSAFSYVSMLSGIGLRPHFCIETLMSPVQCDNSDNNDNKYEIIKTFGASTLASCSAIDADPELFSFFKTYFNLVCVLDQWNSVNSWYLQKLQQIVVHLCVFDVTPQESIIFRWYVTNEHWSDQLGKLKGRWEI